jgi:hypothetical protein
VYKLPINHKEGKIWYPIYTKEEAQDENLSFLPWKKAKEGEYALSDDGIVALVIKKTTYPHAKTGKDTVYLRFPWGYFMYQPFYKTKKLLAEGRRSPHTFTGKTGLEVEAGQTKMKNLALFYSRLWDENLAIDTVIGSVTPAQRFRWQKKMKSEVFKDMVREELEGLLEKHGKTKGYTLDLLDSTIEMAKEKKDVTNLMRAVENLQDMHGMKDKAKVKTTVQLEAVQTKRLLADIQEEEQRMKKIEITVQDAKE